LQAFTEKTAVRAIVDITIKPFKRAVMNSFQIAPSILSADFARLGEEVDNVLAAGADIVHFDVMDNHYVPNLTIGPMVCEALRKHGVTAPIDVHLMVSPVDDLIRMFIDAGASYITFHPEASNHIDRSLQVIREGGCKAGLVFNPATPLHYIDHVMDKLDMILLMSVNPGFGGQKFIPGTLDKLREARKRIDTSGRNIRLEIDGGVKTDNIREIAEAGADTFVAGSAIFNTDDYKATIDKMRAELELAKQSSNR
jgi:ribulose-phosphate 3-epimerase